MKKIAVYGKGGSGKSTVSAALSVVFARRGLKVLHVGCDPKADSTFTLTGGRRITTLLDLLALGDLRPTPDRFIVRGRLDIDCIEAGGPRPGAGCGGRGIARMFELFSELELLEKSNHDIVMFDVLGDVVCGGFAAPLRLGFADRAFIVVSEEPLSLYAANNIVHAIDTYSANGVRLGGLILNVSDDVSGVKLVSRFADAIGAPLAGIIPRDKAVQEAERQHLTAAELPGESPTVAAIELLADTVIASFDGDGTLPRPLDVDTLFSVMGGRAPVPALPASPAQCAADHTLPAPISPAKTTATARGPARAGARTLPAGRDVTGGAASRRRLASLLGLDRPKTRSLMLDVSAAVYRRDHFFVTVESPAIGKLVLELGPTMDGKKTFARAGGMSIAHTSPLKPATRKVLDFVVRRLQRTEDPWSKLEQAFAKDPEASVEASEEDRKDAQKRTVGFAPRHWSVWGTGGTGGLFIFEQERRRQVLAEVRVGDGATHVHHGTEACQASEQDTNPYSSHFVRHPWHLETGEHETTRHASSFLTNLQDHHLIAGSNSALSGVLEEVQRRGSDAPVCIDISCTPVIAGEDWQGTVRRFAQGYDGPVLSSAVGGTDLSIMVAEAGLAALEQATPLHEEPSGLHLVGFPTVAGVDELISLMENAGLGIRQRQLPTVSLAGLSRYAEAKCQLLWPQIEYEPAYEKLYRRSSVPSAAVPPPFGITGTTVFLQAAARASEVDPIEVLERAGPQLAAAGEKLDEFRAEAGMHRLGVALAASQTGILDDPGRLCGIPVAGFLEELGFQVEILDDSQDAGRLNWWLRSGLSAVLTDLTFDERLFAAGVAPFGLADLEPGPEGAVRTVRRLLGLCRTRFFSNYARYHSGGER